MKEKWTVILRTQGKNNTLELKNALNSLIGQSYNNISVLLTIHSDNDKDIKETLEFIKPYQEMIELSPIVLRRKQGKRAYPLNQALKRLDCKYVSFLDDDDIYYPHMGTTLITAMEKEGKTFVFGRGVDVTEKLETNRIGEKYLYRTFKAKRPYQKFSIPLFMLENFIPFNTFVVKRDLIGETRFNEEMRYFEDWDFLKKLLLKKNFSYLQLETLVSEYRKRNDSTDTYNENTYQEWLSSRAITDNTFKDKQITTTYKELYLIKDFYNQLLQNELEREREKRRIVENQMGYRIWNAIINNKILGKTVVKVVRKLRHLTKD